MGMTRRQAVLLVLLLLAAAAVGWLALRSRQPPLLPADAAHAEAAGTPACLECHGPGRPFPRGPNHPLGEDCLRCHGARG
jgi:mono/diheme cytochrome c family protein